MKTSKKMTAKSVNKVHKNTFKVLPTKKGKAIAGKTAMKKVGGKKMC